MGELRMKNDLGDQIKEAQVSDVEVQRLKTSWGLEEALMEC